MTGDFKNAVLYKGISFLIFSSFWQLRYNLWISRFCRGSEDFFMVRKRREDFMVNKAMKKMPKSHIPSSTAPGAEACRQGKIIQPVHIPGRIWRHFQSQGISGLDYRKESKYCGQGENLRDSCQGKGQKGNGKEPQQDKPEMVLHTA